MIIIFFIFISFSQFMYDLFHIYIINKYYFAITIIQANFDGL